MGFGHRVYKNFDPRATIIREMCHKVLADLNVNDPLLDVAMELEEAALKDSYFVERKLYPNVDFYSGIIYKALKIPTEMFTVMFAIARTAGWVAHWLEQHEDPETKIGRPRQIYTGAAKRDYIDDRQALSDVSLADEPRLVRRRSCVALTTLTSCARTGPRSRTSSSTAARCRAPHRFLVDAVERRLAQAVVRQHGDVDRAVAGAEHEHRHVGASMSRSRRRRRVRSSYGMPCSCRNIAMRSPPSSCRCRQTAECSSAVPSSTGPTSRGSKSAKKRIASSAASRSRAALRAARSRGTGAGARAAHPRSRRSSAG